MVEDVKKLAKEYEEAIESIKGVKSRLYSVIIKYLLASSYDPSKRTEAKLTEELGLPRSTVRKALAELSEEGVLNFSAFGESIKPYGVESLGRALDRGYVTLTREEIDNYLGVKEREGYYGSFSGQCISRIENGKPLYRYRGEDDIKRLRYLILRFLSFTSNLADEQTTKKTNILRTITGSEIYRRLEPYFMERESLDLFHEQTGLDILGFSRELAKELEKSETVTEESVKMAIRKSMERRLENVLFILQPFIDLLKNEGFQGAAKRLDEMKRKEKRRWVVDYYEGDPYKFRKEYVWGVTLALRDGCTISEKAGADPELIKKARETTEFINRVMEKK